MKMNDELQPDDAQLQLPLQHTDASGDRQLFDADSAARADALDTQRSFIVRAPAGSGKTELLTQRVLALLAQADAPEEIVAITFTRKAAAEMKDRLLQSLAQADAASQPDKPHHALTRQLAQRVAARDKERGWELAANPARLRVQTIDALALWLAQQRPITTRFSAIANVTEQAGPLYDAAAYATLKLIDSPEPQYRSVAHHIARLLTHLDNDWLRLHRLLSGMLARRDQWLRHVGRLDRAALEAPMQRECARQIERVCNALPEVHATELIALARFAAGNLAGGSRLAPCADLDRLPEMSHRQLDVWRALAAVLLTNDGTWRIRFSKSEGFPSTAYAEPFKQRIVALIDALRPNEALREALHGLRELPAPHFTTAQWEILESIVALLPRAAAELILTFADAGETDFVQVTRAAADALGDEDASSDITHALDARVRHLLVDEFQDTSITQFELIERLVADWQPDDGRTMFVVGDPMQSIYRFREAEVGLFLRAWNDGIAGVPLQQLNLARNFRSQRGLVDWANSAFVQVLPANSDLASGAVAFEASVADESTEPASVVESVVLFHALPDGSPRDEAMRVVGIVQRIRSNDPDASIALLVRARTHVAQIVPALREAGLSFTAVELELLLARPLVGDLLALTRALEHLADKVAWLAILRAPWCGLTLADLTALAEGGTNATVWQLIGDPARRSQLSADGELRLARVASVLARALELRGRSPLAERVRETWWLLGGPACISTPADHADADSFFDHLTQHEERSRGVPDIAAFEASLVRLYAASAAPVTGGLQVMTIHKAKGLEFDHVIVPGLDRVTTGDDTPLMRWLERPTENGSGELLLSPIFPPDVGKKDESIYCWIERLQQQRQAHEDERLLYVAATRARRRLHWIACVPTMDDDVSPPRENSLLQRLWPAVEANCRQALAERMNRNRDTFATTVYDQSLRRLPSDWVLPVAPTSIGWQPDELSAVKPAIEFSWAGETARRIGIIVHRWLQRIADDSLRGWDSQRVHSIAPHIERELAGAGLSGEELKAARLRVEQALVVSLADARARWLLGPQADARTELRLTVLTSGQIKHIALDRTFVDADGARWIIDYKSGIHQGTDVAAFLDREQLRYQQQLESYADAFDGSSKLGLYFPLIPGWREWSRERHD